jgi:lipopolysaccharide transport system permease protein
LSTFIETANDPPVTVIERRSGWQIVDWRELWRYRELLLFLTWRDVKVRYKQTVLGAAWAVVQPLATMIVFSLVLGRIAQAPGSSVPYPLFVFAGLLPWTFFANALTSASQSVVGSQNLVTKVYFPRLIIPMGAVGTSIVDFLVAFAMLLGLMLCYGMTPGWGLLAVPFLAAGLTLAALGIGTLLCALTVAYRDVRHLVPFLMQLWMFATPSIYLQAGDGFTGAASIVLLLNPAHGFITNFRAAMLGGAFDLPALAMSSAIGGAFLLGGCFYFRQVERSFADII